MTRRRGAPGRPVIEPWPPGVTVMGLTLITLLGVALRLWLLRFHPSYYADEAVAGLMAKHIAEGREIPAFYYGQAYFGALQSYVTAGIALVTGWRWWLIYVAPFTSSLVMIWLAFALGRRLAGDRAGLVAATLVALPGAAILRVMLTGDAFAFAAMLELGLIATALGSYTAWRWRWLGWCFGVGVAGWIWQLWWVVAVPLLIWVWRRCRPGLGWTIAGVGAVALGAAPLITQNVIDPFSTFWSLSPRIGVFKGVAPAEWQARAQSALQDPQFSYWTESLAGLAGGNVGILVGGLAAAGLGVAIRANPTFRSLGLLYVALTALTWAPGLSAQRYMLVPATLLAALLGGVAAQVWSRAQPATARLGLIGLTVALVVGNGLTYATDAVKPWQGPGEHRHLVAELTQRGVTRGWADYWTAYPTILLTDERIILAPALVTDDGVLLDRYPRYRDIVESASGEQFCIVHAESADVARIREAIDVGECSPFEPFETMLFTVCRVGTPAPCGLAGR